jgi:tetratricopeptide (TPR) repeat protein
MARRLGRADLLASAALGYRGPAEMGSPSDPPTVALLEEALAAVGDGFPVLRARLLSRMAGTPPFADVMATRAALSRDAYALAERTCDDRAIRDALSARLWASLGPDHVDARLAVGRELLAFSARGGGLPMAMLAHDAALGAHLLRGDMRAAERALAAYGEVAATLRQPAFNFLATFWMGSLALARGELDAAERAFHAALERGRDTVPYAHFMFAGQMYPILYLRGRDDDPEIARVFFGEMMALPYAFEPAVRSALAFGLWLRGERDEARREYERVMARVDAGLERDEHWLMTLGGLARLAVLLNDAARAARLADLLAPYADLVLVHDLLRAVGEPVAAVLGHVSIVLGRFDDGAAHYERALAKATAMGARLALLDARAGYARLLARRGGPGDRARAATLAEEAAVEAAALGVRRNWLDELPA